jgi:hypothetical protein
LLLGFERVEISYRLLRTAICFCCAFLSGRGAAARPPSRGGEVRGEAVEGLVPAAAMSVALAD